MKQPVSLSSQARRAFLVGASFRNQPTWLVEEHLDELAELTASAGVKVAGRSLQKRPKPDAGTFIGKGKASEIATAADEVRAIW